MMVDYAYSKFNIVTLAPTLVEVHWETNDDGDTGYPGTWASDTWTFSGEDALEKALRHTGKSRQGVGQRVFVTLDGEVI